VATPNVGVIIPVHKSQRDHKWLKTAIQSLPEGVPVTVAENDGDVAGAVNEAVRASESKWVLVLGSDDEAGPQMLDRMLGLAFNAEVVYPACLEINERNEVFAEEAADPFCPHRLLSDMYVPPGSLVLREAFLDVGGYRGEPAPFESWDLYVRGVRKGWRFKPAVGAFYYRRIHEGSRTFGKTPQAVRGLVVGAEQDYKATFYYQASHACAYLRCQVPARHLPGTARPELIANVIPVEGLERSPESAEEIDRIEFPLHNGAGILQFAGDSTWAVLSMHLQEAGHKVLVDVDDNYLNDLGETIRKQTNWGVNIGDSIHTAQGHRWIVKNADGVIVTTEQLARSYRKFNENVYVIPNPVDASDWYPINTDDGVFRVGWFASRSHLKDIPLVTRALEWASQQDGVEVVTMGLDPLFKFPYKHYEWVDDLDTYRVALGLLDVGLAPIKPNPFSVYRSDVKASEYTMGGAAVICSDVPSYVDWTHEENCLKAQSAKDFYHHVKRLVQNKDEARSLAGQGRKWVDENRSIQALLPLWEEAIS